MRLELAIKARGGVRHLIKVLLKFSLDNVPRGGNGRADFSIKFIDSNSVANRFKKLTSWIKKLVRSGRIVRWKPMLESSSTVETDGAIMYVRMEKSRLSQGFRIDASFPFGVRLNTSSVRCEIRIDMDGVEGGRKISDLRST